jgi:hypothetical protein
VKNDREWSKSLGDVLRGKKSFHDSQNASAVMVWGAISRKRRLSLVFIKRRVYKSKLQNGGFGEVFSASYPDIVRRGIFLLPTRWSSNDLNGVVVRYADC